MNPIEPVRPPVLTMISTPWGTDHPLREAWLRPPAGFQATTIIHDEVIFESIATNPIMSSSTLSTENASVATGPEILTPETPVHYGLVLKVLRPISDYSAGEYVFIAEYESSRFILQSVASTRRAEIPRTRPVLSAFGVLPKRWDATPPRRTLLLTPAGNAPAGTVLNFSGARCGYEAPGLLARRDSVFFEVMKFISTPVRDDGSLEFPEDLAHLAAYQITPELRRQVELYPQLEITRGLLRRQTKHPVPPELTTAEQIFAWLDQLPKFTAPPLEPDLAPAPAPAPETLTATPRRVPTVPLSYERTERVDGRCSYSYTRTWSGTLHVPVDVIARGEGAVEEWLGDHYDDLDVSDDNNYDYSDHEDSDTSVEEDSYDSDELFEDARADYPEYFADEDAD